MNPTTNPTGTPRRTPTKPAGWIYIHHTATDPHKYVGQSKRPVWNRINEERRGVNALPWGAELLPGRAGYTILRRVDTLGDPRLDAIALDLAEAEEIERWNPTENAFRPDPQVFRNRLAAAQLGELPTPAVGPTRRGTPPPRVFTGPARRRTVPWRTVGFVVLSAGWAVFAGWLATYWPNPTAPWVGAPMAAVVGPAITVGLYRYSIRPTPKRRRRRRRR